MNYICGIDIGSSKVCAVLAKLNKRRITGLYFATVNSKGVEKGAVTDSIGLIGCIERLLKDLKAKSGINIKVIYVNISGQDIITRHSRAVLPLAERGNKVITLSDIERVNNEARILGSSLEDEIIHQIPFSYSIDSKSDILKPLGLYSHRLEVDVYLVCAKMSSVQNLIHVVSQAGYEIKDLFLSGIAISKIVFGKEITEGTNVLCDVGADITELLIFRDGILKGIEIMPLGGNDLTLEIQEALKLSFELAEDVKRTHCSIGDDNSIQQDKEILIKKNNTYKPIKQKLLSEILTTKAKFICQSIKERLERTLPCNHIDNFVATGRTVLLEGFLETLENSLGIPVKIGRIGNPEIAQLINRNDGLSGSKYLAYIAALGIISQVLRNENVYLSSANQLSSRNLFLKVINRAKEVYQEYF